MNLSNRDVEIIVEKLKFYKTEIKSQNNITKANLAYELAIKKICEIIHFKRFDLLEKLVNIRDSSVESTIILFLLPISEIKIYKKLFKLLFLQKTSFETRILWSEYKVKKRLKFPKLFDNKVIYVSKDEYLEQFSKEEIKKLNSFL